MNIILRSKPHSTFFLFRNGIRRHYYSNELKADNVLIWIQGGTSHIASSVRAGALKKNWKVISAQRKDTFSKLQNSLKTEFEKDGLKFVKLIDATNRDEVKNLLCDNIDSNFQGTIVFFNAIGGVNLSKSATLEKLNYDSAVSFASAINEFVSKKDKIHSILIHCSSIAANLISNSEYGKIKLKTDLELLSNKYMINCILCFRIGYVVQSLIRPGEMSHAHAFGQEQLAYFFPLQPVIVYDKNPSKEEEKTGMIYPVHMDDLVQAVTNVPAKFQNKKNIKLIINAVGSEGYTQADFSKFYTDLMNKPFEPYNIHIEDFEVLATEFPLGHIAKYAAEYFRQRTAEKIDEASFKELLGRDLTPLKKIAEEIKALSCPESEKLKKLEVMNPIGEYALVLLKNFPRSSKKAKKVLVSFIFLYSLQYAIYKTKRL